MPSSTKKITDTLNIKENRKKRNRDSAKRSRDNVKEKILALEEKTLALEEKLTNEQAYSKQLKRENDELKKTNAELKYDEDALSEQACAQAPIMHTEHIELEVPASPSSSIGPYHIWGMSYAPIDSPEKKPDLNINSESASLTVPSLTGYKS